MTQIEIDCMAALEQALYEKDSVYKAEMPAGYSVLAKTAPFTFLVGTPDGGVFVSDLTELRHMLSR